MLDQACATSPTDTQWWIKGDAVDIVARLKVWWCWRKWQEIAEDVSIFDCAQAVQSLPQGKRELEQHLDLFSTSTYKMSLSITPTFLALQDKLEKQNKFKKAMFELACKVESLIDFARSVAPYVLNRINC